MSFLVPLFNEYKYLKRSIKPILELKRPDYEIVLVDDASTDSSPNYILQQLLKYPNIRFVRHYYNQGHAYSRYHSLKYSTGRHVTFLDADDYINVSLIETIYSGAIRSNADVYDSYSNIINYNRTSKKYHIQKLHQKKRCVDTNDKKMVELIFYRKRNHCALWRKFFKREILENAFNMVIPLIKNKKFTFAEDDLINNFIYPHTHILGCSHQLFYFYTGKSSSAKIKPSLQKDYEFYLKYVYLTVKRMMLNNQNYADINSIKYQLYTTTNASFYLNRIPNIVPHKAKFACSLYAKYKNMKSFSNNEDGLCFVHWENQ